MALTDTQIQASATSASTYTSIQSDYSSGNLVLIISLANGQTVTLTFLTRDDLDAFIQTLWSARV